MSNIDFELYDCNNKVPYERYNEMLKIIIPFYSELLNKDFNKKEEYEPWINMIRNTNDYYVLICIYNNEVIGFINYMYQEEGLMLSEVQIKEKYRSKGILKSMIREVINNSDKDKYDGIYLTINPDNKKSIDVFTHIGFKNVKNRLYYISYKNLLKWIK